MDCWGTARKGRMGKIWKTGFEKLSESLTREFGRGFSETNLEYARKFYFTYTERIFQTLFEEFAVKKS